MSDLYQPQFNDENRRPPVARDEALAKWPDLSALRRSQSGHALTARHQHRNWRYVVAALTTRDLSSAAKARVTEDA